MNTPIYLDYNAATPLDTDVYHTVILQLKEGLGNPSSVHSFGKKERSKIAEARRLIAHYLKTKPGEILFTAGGTDGVNLLLRGIACSQKKKGKKVHIITSSIEHPCVYQTVKALEENEGIEAQYLNPDTQGRISAESLEQAITKDTSLIALSAANSETGVLQDYLSYAKIAEKKAIALVIDGVALLGKGDLLIPKGITGMAFSGQKIGALPGSGFIFLRQRTPLIPLMTGGPQEFGLRAGSESVASIMGLGIAVEKIRNKNLQDFRYVKELRDYLESSLLEISKDFYVHGAKERLINTLNICFKGKDGEHLLLAFDKEGIAVSLGSACSSGALEPSRVLLNMGVTASDALSSLRFSLGLQTTKNEIDEALKRIKKVIMGFF
jgi:cysteine desulfurase